MRIVVTGTPGVGKTTVSLRLAEKLSMRYLNLNEELVKLGVCKYNPELATYEITDIDKAVELIDKIMEENDNTVFDTLLVELVNPELVDYVIVLRLDPYILYNRLKNVRGWTGKKLCENVMAEILDYFLIKAIENVGQEKVIEINTTGKDVESIVSEITQCIENKCTRVGIVDWLSVVSPDFLLYLDQCREVKFTMVEESV